MIYEAVWLRLAFLAEQILDTRKERRLWNRLVALIARLEALATARTSVRSRLEFVATIVTFHGPTPSPHVHR